MNDRLTNAPTNNKNIIIKTFAFVVFLIVV